MSTATAPRLSSVYADALDELVADQPVAQPPHPELTVLNKKLAAELGIGEWAETDDALAVLSGGRAPAESRPVAMAYAGHQFGGYSPLLGDGRALLLGELATPAGDLVDLHLKGSGRTRFARGGDGKATLGAMLREFLVAEAMHALGVRTARALAVVTTGETVMRERPEPGAVLTRVAASHVRVGTFELAARQQSRSLLRRLADHTIERHYPDLAESDDRYLRLLDRTVEAQAELIASWMLVGFIHGVMNTDNTLLSGETIDYGPCAYIEGYDPAAVFSSIDHGGRYAYGNQPAIAEWNLARLAEALLPLIDDNQDAAVERAVESVKRFGLIYERQFGGGLVAKIGLDDSTGTSALGSPRAVADELLEIMHRRSADFTRTFRALATALRGDRGPALDLLGGDFDSWEAQWHHLLPHDHQEVAMRMDTRNPLYIPRNHLVEEALEAAASGDVAGFETLLSATTDPFVERPGMERFAMPAPPGYTESHQTFCGT